MHKVKVSMETEIEFKKSYLKPLEKAVTLALEKGLKVREAKTVYVWVVKEDTIRDLKKRHMGVDEVSDVLAFPQTKNWYKGKPLNNGVDVFPNEEKRFLGEIFLCPSKVCLHAKARHHSFRYELAFFAAHSTLHLLGFDHLKVADEIEMQTISSEVASGLDITDLK